MPSSEAFLSRPDRVPALKGESEQGVLPLTKKLSINENCWQRKKTCFSIINHTSGQAPGPGVVGQYKMNSKDFMESFALCGSLVLSVSCLFILIFICKLLWMFLCFLRALGGGFFLVFISVSCFSFAFLF